MSHGRHVGSEVRDVACSLRRSGDLVCLRKAEESEHGDLEDVSRGRRDGGRYAQYKSPLIKVVLVAFKGQADLLWEGSADGIVCRRGECQVESHSLH